MHPSIVSVIILVSIVNVLCIVCPENYCSGFKCEKVNCGEGQTQILGTCECCKVCATILEEGKFCGSVGEILSPQPSKTVCAENLICYKNKCQKEKDVVADIAAYNNE